MTYMIAGGERLNVVLSHPDDIDTGGWSTERLMAEIKNQFTGWDTQ